MVNLHEDIYVDLDGTLVQTDLLFESAIQLLKNNFFYIALFPFWLLKGRSHLKSKIAERTSINIDSLPYNHNLIEYLREKKNDGHHLFLATASHQKFADQVSEHLGIFQGVIATNDRCNLKSHQKLVAIRKNSDRFSYIGNSRDDYCLFEHAQNAILVNGSKRFTEKTNEIFKIDRVFPVTPWSFKTLLSSLRIYQWTKNVLLFIPLFLSGSLSEEQSLSTIVMMFFSFSLLASATYIFNDLSDIENDRQHPRKCSRPIASGVLPIPVAILSAFILIIASYSIAFLIGPMATMGLSCYLVITLFYTYIAKTYFLVDVIFLATLYTIRIIIGAVVINLDVSIWLLAFSMFIFLSLALVKRVSELLTLQQKSRTTTSGRDYTISDVNILTMMGIVSAFISVLVIMLFIAEGTEYKNPEFIWFICPIVLYWTSRLWFKTIRHEMTDDPIVFAFKDKGSLVCGIFIFITISLSIYL